MRVRDVMTTQVVTASPGNSLWHAASIMLAHDVSGLPVVDDDGRLVGMITEGDLLRRVAQSQQGPGGNLRSLSWSVGDVMTADVITVAEDALITVVAALMDQRRIRRIPVMRAGRLVGIVSRKDILRVIASDKPDDIAPGDAAMRLAIVTRLGESVDLRGSQVVVAIEDGIMRLGGAVDTAAQRDLARAIAESVRGAAGVRNEVQVRKAARSNP